MKRHGRLFDKTASLTNLWNAWREFRKGKRDRPSVRRFELDCDRNIVQLKRLLNQNKYHHGSYRLFFVREPKVRLIAAASVRDRVVHHAVHQILSPLMDPSLIHTTFACLPERGTHRAAIHFMNALRSFDYALMLDIRHYFLSIDRNILMTLMQRKIKDSRILELLQNIADSGAYIYQIKKVKQELNLPRDFPPPECGLPIGNLTSQWWGNHYLSGLDHFIKRDLKIPHMQRYMDDLALFHNSKKRLKKASSTLKTWLMNERRLYLKEPFAEVRSSRGKFNYLGFRITRGGITPSRKLMIKMRRRLKHIADKGDAELLKRSIESYKGIWKFLHS